MHQAVENIIDRLIGAIKSDKPYYTLKDFLSAGFPSFIVERIRIEINEKLKQEFELRDSRWAKVQDELVQEAWKDFQQALFANSRIPKDKLYDITSRVITEMVKVYLEPRRHMADYIYKGDEELGYEELVRRTDKLTIYKHFGRAIPLYMKKRGLTTLGKNRCKLLIHNLDANLVASYTAKDWAKVLELLFTLFGGKVDAKLIRLFFEDKGLYLTAKAFNELDEEIDKERFTEILSYPDLLDVQLQEKFRDRFREELIARKNQLDQTDEEHLDEIDEQEQRLLDNFFDDYEEDETATQMTDEESFNALFKTEQADKSIFEEFEEVPDAEEISKSLKKEEKSDDIKAFRQNLSTVLDQAVHSFKNLSREEEENKNEQETGEKETSLERKQTEQNQEPETEPEDQGPGLLYAEEPDENLVVDEDADEEEKPMWQQYLSADQMEVMMGEKEAQEEEGIVVTEDDFIEDLVETEPEKSSGQNEKAEIPDIKEYLGAKENFYVKEIFNGSERKYDKALKTIQVFEEWEKAAGYLHKDIFSANKADMFSETAVEFTDRLQSYFNEYKN